MYNLRLLGYIIKFRFSKKATKFDLDLPLIFDIYNVKS